MFGQPRCCHYQAWVSEVFKMVATRITVFQDVTLCILVGRFQKFWKEVGIQLPTTWCYRPEDQELQEQWLQLSLMRHKKSLKWFQLNFNATDCTRSLVHREVKEILYCSICTHFLVNPIYKWLKFENRCQHQKLTAECDFSSHDATYYIYLKRCKQNSLTIFSKMIIK